ncbi:DNA/RNA nuclease SfsA [Hydrogenivirga sp. 128-5-R1-1]|uniref:DNA/RNA nuclease SfsA n=1 Tax=Hydrogenivirga sp. 128-5-R1-1 TaxID=392423 RepID=UPI00015F2D2B|nr:DNA/RNA nuclease SfsA [Hydrogenivirga sp. 128-5-R1-1]EDP74603.1 sugar fermentation stimulation protein [Hydrogenivirga sp. 128-5-R1-1]
MKLGELIPAKFLERENRFVCLVEVCGKPERVLIRNTGRLKELLVPGRKVYLREKNTGKYRHELILVELESGLVCVDSHLPPKLLLEHLLENSYPWKVKEYRYEYRVGNSRFDLLLNRKVLIETKSVNLVVDRTAMFPDAPTQRGRRHIEELMDNADKYEPAVVFIVQRKDAAKFTPNRGTDPDFSRALERFAREGFTVKAFLCDVKLEEIRVSREIPVIF